MKRAKQNGFVLIVVVMLLSLFAMASFILTTSSVTMAYESTTAALQAQSRNLTASAIAWAEHNAKKLNQLEDGMTLRLDVSNMKAPQATCDITAIKPENGKSEIKINTRCTRGKRIQAQSVTLSQW